MNTTQGEYTTTAKWLHWIMAALIVLAWLIGFYVSDLPKGPEKAAIMAWHKGLGMAVLALMTVRLAWRLLHPPPRLPDTLSPGLQRAAHSAHWTLYGLMIAQPLSGWAVSSANGYPVKAVRPDYTACPGRKERGPGTNLRGDPRIPGLGSGPRGGGSCRHGDQTSSCGPQRHSAPDAAWPPPGLRVSRPLSLSVTSI
ncbi:cytochrome b [Methylococcus capsulatus]|uniref:cytochrome b n=1 Tax=Methylococcus capsulatus TaxID=414 RepID=UPI003CEC254F